MAKAEYWKAPEVEELAKKLMGIHHPYITGVNIVYVFSSKVRKRKQNIILASIDKYNERQKMISGGCQLVLEVAKEVWDKLDTNQREAVIDHELSHVLVDDESGEVSLIEHDVNEFGSIIKRYGPYLPSLQLFIADYSKYVDRQLDKPLDVQNHLQEG